MTQPTTVTMPTLPEVMAAVPILLEPGVDVGRAPVAAALWVLASGIPQGSPVWKHVGTQTQEGPFGLDFAAMRQELTRFTDQWALVSIARDVVYRNVLSMSRMWTYLSAQQQGAVLQALMILKAGKNREWPHMSDSMEAIFDAEPEPEAELARLQHLMKYVDRITIPLDVSELGPEALDLDEAFAVMLVKGPKGRWAVQRAGRAGGFWDSLTGTWDSGSDIDWHGYDALELAWLAVPEALAAQTRAAKAYAERRAERRRAAEGKPTP